MTHNPEVCSYSAISVINNSFRHLTDYREGREHRDKKPDDKDMQCMFGDQNHGTSHELNEIPPAISPFLHYSLCTVL
jgi:hypothetical protein